MTIARDILRKTAVTSTTTLVIQLTTFAVLALAPLILPERDFAALVVIVAATMLSNAFFDLGLNLTATKFFGESKDAEWFISANRIRLLSLPLACILSLLTAWLLAESDIAIGILCGAFLNLWNGIRSTDQARQHYLSFSRASMIFAGLRISFGSFALLVLRDPLAIAIALYVVPVLAIRASISWPLLATGLRRSGRRSFRRMLEYALPVYLNALVFVGLPYIPQFIVAERFGDLAAGQYGLLISFTAPISLLVYSLRAVLLPKIVGREEKIETFMWSQRGVLVITGIAILFSLGGACIGLLLEQIYGQRFPGIGISFLIFFTGFSITSAVGFYSLSVHTLGVPYIAVWISLAKIALLAVLLIFNGHSLNHVIASTSGAMISGELLLAALLFHARKNTRP